MLPEWASRRSSDPEDLPEQEQPDGSRRKAMALWLVVISLAVFFLPLNLVSSSVRDKTARLEAELQPIQETLASIGTPGPEAQQLMDTLKGIQESADAVKEAYPTIAASHFDWPAVMSAIGKYDPGQLRLTSLTQADKQITLHGLAVDDSVVVAYARALEETNLFSRVVVQSIRSIAVPTATPEGSGEKPTKITPTPITPTASPTSTPSLGDEYEIDDVKPAFIFLGEQQMHNFYPVYDVDRLQFLAKAGRCYRVFTSGLAPGVDTFLTVNVGEVTYTNDDLQPGDVSSEVVFQVVGGQDVDAIITVTNRGQYGSDKWYQVSVEEIIVTPTPTCVSSATPTATGTATPVVTPTSSVTPDLRDGYEPDDAEPRPIAIGETQAHNFYPLNDVDMLQFLAKAGRYYRISTSGLTLGVDTFLTVDVGEVVYTNDDRQAGDLSSEVVFQVVGGQDVDALITVTNRGQYGSDKWYQVSVEEVIVTPTPTRVSNVIPTATSSVTPDLRDGYEPDDAEPRPIAIGETQAHNFYPLNDVDMLQFLAKAGRYYRISTSGLTLGVDTSLAVDVGGVVYTNDDRQAGDLSSEVVFQVVGGQDVDAIITVTNRGQYGSDKWYQVSVEEVIVTPTPTYTASSLPLRLPGLASLLPGFARPDRSRLSQIATERTNALVHSSAAPGDRKAAGVPGLMRVEFVIVLELKAR